MTKLTVYVNKMLPDQRSITNSLSGCLRLFWIITVVTVIHQVPFTIADNEAEASPPRNVRARSDSPSDIRLEWDEPEISNGVIQGYKIFYTTSPELPIALWTNKVLAAKSKMTTISGLIPDRTYTISVLAYSSIGEGPMSVPVQVVTGQYVPRKLWDLRAATLSPNAIEVTWGEATENIGEVIDYTLYYSDSKNYSNGQVTVPASASKYILTDLVPDTEYVVILGVQVFGNHEQAKTMEFIPNEPKIVQVQAVNSTSIYVEWQPPRAKVHNRIIRGYYVFYVQLNENNEPVKRPGVEDVDDGNKLEAIMTGLLPDTCYEVTLAAYTRRGDGFRSKDRIVCTTKPVPATNLSVEVVHREPLIAKVSWPEQNSSYGHINGYRLNWGPKGQINDGVLFTETQHTWVSPRLDPEAVYEFRLHALNEESSEQIAVAEFHYAGHKKQIPSKTKRVKVQAVNSTTIYVEWRPPRAKDRNRNILGHYVYYVRLDESDKVIEGTEKVEDVNDGSQNEVVLTGLLPDTGYQVTVSAYTMYGAGERSRPKIVNTKGAE